MKTASQHSGRDSVPALRDAIAEAPASTQVVHPRSARTPGRGVDRWARPDWTAVAATSTHTDPQRGYDASHGRILGAQCDLRALIARAPGAQHRDELQRPRSGMERLNAVDALRKVVPTVGSVAMLVACATNPGPPPYVTRPSVSDVYEFAFSRCTSLEHATLHHDLGAVQQLLARGAAPDAHPYASSCWANPLQMAMGYRDWDIAIALLQKGADATVSSRFAGDEGEPRPLLFLAAESHNAPRKLVELLVANGADPNQQFQSAAGVVTPLMAASTVAQTEVVEALLLAGAKPSTKDHLGRTALDYAKASTRGGRRAVNAMLTGIPAGVQQAPPRVAPSEAVVPALVESSQAVEQGVKVAPQPTARLLAVGVERYADIPSALGAQLDARRFAAIAPDSLGISPKHIALLTDAEATKGRLEREVARVVAGTPQGGRIYFYFSGHGAPDPSSGASFLLPHDADAKFLSQTSIAVSDILQRLSAGQAREVIVLVDACFSGSGARSVMASGVRPLVRVVSDKAPSRVALFAASAANEIAGGAEGRKAGLFSDVLIRAFASGVADHDGDGQVSLQELNDWVAPRVSRAAKGDNRMQTPTLTVGTDLGDASTVMVQWGLAETK